jgi:hypothetical protein
MKKEVQFKDKPRRFSFEKRENPMKKFDIQKILTVRKMNQNEKSKKDISNEIDDYFESPEKYFQKNSPVSIGKKIYIFDINDPKLRRENRLKTERKITKNYFNNLVSLASKMSSKDNNAFNKSFKNISKEKQDFLDRYEVIDNYKLKKIFDSYKIKSRQKDDSIDKNQNTSSSITDLDITKDENNTKNKLINSSYFFENIPNDIKKSLSNQNKKLLMRKMIERNNKLLSQYLSKKVNKPQNNLLLNKIDLYRFKKEVIHEIENRKPPDEKYGRFKWNISLRKPDSFKGVRDSYINLKGERFNPFWSIVIERSPRLKDLSIIPRHENKRNNLYESKNRSLNAIYTTPSFKTIENLEDLTVDGKNLYKLEYKREITDSKERKILHKVFIENGKAITHNEINNLFGHDTFYKNYTGCQTEKNMTMKASSYFNFSS